MRRLLFQTPIQPKIFRPMSAETMARRRYGAGHKHLATYISDKYGLHLRDVRMLLRDVFKYLSCEVMLGSGVFTVRGIGQFRRSVTGHLFGDRTRSSYRMTVDMAESAKPFHKTPDPEWEDIDESELDEEQNFAIRDYAVVDVTDEEVEAAQERIDAAEAARRDGYTLTAE